ncbi:MAG: nucleotide exchange factor GrpE [Chloroflexota bacterium]|jgi:molecular chaperone GrpE|nr:nucleotide exchange factor GrpE [Lentimicrobium sp.]
MKQRKKHENGIDEQTQAQQNDQAPVVEAAGNTNSNKLNENESEVEQNRSTIELQELQQKYNEVNDKYLRLYSDFDNFRKRALKEKIELSKTASEQVLVDFLTILDDFERAISSFETVDTIEPLKEGTVLIYNKFKNNLTQKGIMEIDAMGKQFDTDFHEAIANVPAPEEQKNKVIDVTQKGYTLNGKVIRFAKVVVGA